MNPGSQQGTHSDANQPTQATQPDASDITVWQPFDAAYSAFAKAHPMLGLHIGEWAVWNLRRTHGPALLAAGAMLRLPNRRWLAHVDKFGPALFEALTHAPQAIIDQARARGAPPPPTPAGAATSRTRTPTRTRATP